MHMYKCIFPISHSSQAETIFFLVEREKKGCVLPLFTDFTPVASLSCIPACWMTGAWQEPGLSSPIKCQWRRFMFTLQHKEMILLGPTKIFCFAFLRHSNNSPVSSVAEPYLSVFGTLCHRHGEPGERMGESYQKLGSSQPGLHGAPQMPSQDGQH